MPVSPTDRQASRTLAEGSANSASAERLFLALPGDAMPGPETGTGPDHMAPLPIPPDLHGIVGQALSYSEVFPCGRTVAERVLPDGAVRLAVNLSPTASTILVVLGPRVSAQIVPLAGCMEGISLALNPAAARIVLGVPASEVANRDVPLTDLWGAAAEDLGDRIMSVSDNRQRAGMVWDALRRCLAAAPDPIVSAWLAPALVSAASPRDLAKALGIGERRVQQVFSERVGLSPRTALRLARWHRLLRSLRGRARPDWASLAQEHGWYDQAHMVRDFRSFAGLTPTAYFAQLISGSSKTAA